MMDTAIYHPDGFESSTCFCTNCTMYIVHGTEYISIGRCNSYVRRTLMCFLNFFNAAFPFTSLKYYRDSIYNFVLVSAKQGCHAEMLSSPEQACSG